MTDRSTSNADADDKSLLDEPPEGADATSFVELAVECLSRCGQVASLTETAGTITRRYLCSCMSDVHDQIAAWMNALDMSVRVDAAGNLIGSRAGQGENLPTLLIGSHLDTVPQWRSLRRSARMFDGVKRRSLFG